MAKYIVETYYTCTFKVKHYLDDISNNQLEEMRKELLSDLYDEKLMLTEDEKSKNRNLGEFVVGLKKRFFDEKT